MIEIRLLKLTSVSCDFRKCLFDGEKKSGFYIYLHIR